MYCSAAQLELAQNISVKYPENDMRRRFLCSLASMLFLPKGNSLASNILAVVGAILTVMTFYRTNSFVLAFIVFNITAYLHLSSKRFRSTNKLIFLLYLLPVLLIALPTPFTERIPRFSFINFGTSKSVENCVKYLNSTSYAKGSVDVDNQKNTINVWLDYTEWEQTRKMFYSDVMSYCKGPLTINYKMLNGKRIVEGHIVLEANK